MTALSTPSFPLDERVAGRPRGWRLLRNPKILAGIGILAFFIALALIRPVLAATIWARDRRVYDPHFGMDTTISHPSGPSWEHWLGTSSLGHDVFSMLAYSTASTLMSAAIAAGIISLIALLLGSLAAYRKGWVDGLVSHLSDAMILLPAMLAVFVLGISRPNEEFGSIQLGLSFGVIYALGPGVATVRAAALTVVAKPFLDLARLSGGGGFWIVSRHVLPHLYAHAAAQAMIGATGAIIAGAFLSFRSAVGEDIGFGMMVYDGITWAGYLAGILPVPWWIMLAGTAGITLLASAFYLIGVGLREALDPRSGELER